MFAETVLSIISSQDYFTSCSWQYFKTDRKPALSFITTLYSILTHVFGYIYSIKYHIIKTTFKTSAMFKIDIVYHKGCLGNTP